MRPHFSLAALALLLAGAPAGAQVAGQPGLTDLADADGDGTVSADEFTAYYSVVWDLFSGDQREIDVERTNPVLRAVIRGVLPTAKGRIRREELLDAVPSHYPTADTDHDGVVTMAEMRAWAAVAMTPHAS